MSSKITVEVAPAKPMVIATLVAAIGLMLLTVVFGVRPDVVGWNLENLPSAAAAIIDAARWADPSGAATMLITIAIGLQVASHSLRGLRLQDKRDEDRLTTLGYMSALVGGVAAAGTVSYVILAVIGVVDHGGFMDAVVIVVTGTVTVVLCVDAGRLRFSTQEAEAVENLKRWAKASKRRLKALERGTKGATAQILTTATVILVGLIASPVLLLVVGNHRITADRELALVALWAGACLLVTAGSFALGLGAARTVLHADQRRTLRAVYRLGLVALYIAVSVAPLVDTFARAGSSWPWSAMVAFAASPILTGLVAPAWAIIENRWPPRGNSWGLHGFIRLMAARGERAVHRKLRASLSSHKVQLAQKS